MQDKKSSSMLEVLKQRKKELDRAREERRKKEQERKEAKRAEIQAEILRMEEQLSLHQPVSFVMAVAESAIESGYNQLLDSKEYANQKLETLKDVKKPTLFDGVLYFVLEVFLGVFVIYSLLYRVMGEEYFSEVTMTFGLDIKPLYIALAFEGLVIVMFSLGMRLYITARFDEQKKHIVALWMKIAFGAFVVAYSGFVYLSNI